MNRKGNRPATILYRGFILQAVGMNWNGALVPVEEIEYAARPVPLAELERFRRESQFRTYRITGTAPRPDGG